MKSFTTALSAIMCICAAQESWGYDLFLEDTLTESEQQATPSPLRLLAQNGALSKKQMKRLLYQRIAQASCPQTINVT